MAVNITDHDGVITLTSTTATAQSLFTDRRHIKNIYWERPTTAGHKVNFITGANKQFVGLYCDVENRSQNLPLDGKPITGLKVNDMDSGTISIFYFK